MNLYALGKALVQIGLLMVLLGGLFLLAGKVGLPFGRLPGDLSFRGRHFIFFAPIGSMILLSLVLTLLLNLFLRWFK
ncbi:MAG: DUF2905 domain-containing protein [Synergistaceae bacterium]|jgi:hypothetical protein|nr:DUF2905 domain-containing protein [Synergistaceae bacterium]